MVQKQRFIAIDIIKTIAVFIMILLHVLIMYGSESTIYNNFSKWLLFIIEGLGAPVFIFSMGASILLSGKKTANQILKRGAQLFVMGYILNLLKFYPTIKILQVFPEALFKETHRVNDTEGLIGFLLLGDILQFAAIAYIICSFIKPYILRAPYLGAILSVAIFIIAPLLYDIGSSNYLLNFIYGKNFQVYFPLLPWIGFAFLGLLIGCQINISQHRNELPKLFLSLSFIGIILLFFGWRSINYSLTQYFSTDYYHRPGGVLMMYCGELLLLFSIAYFASQKLSYSAILFLKFCSNNVTSIYIIQWILVCWGWYFFAYGSQPWNVIILIFLTISAITFGLTYFKEVFNYN
ncbi:heparan-alpha-glucosaminide N-acetyltransferase domain-containing protein [Chryseobacterium sp.]|uniref:heparan-alpha-glucosaminide N-acetyltransferase domain-containing protein n=1 Tax=Chryseobacterium sp. TaxID=1871047 RepID=UPI0025C2E0AF|nr:heparan-alpha-glucosaminide N-acetyltransferase domain-containing protein [Chryseobacterium sp.]